MSTPETKVENMEGKPVWVGFLDLSIDGKTESRQVVIRYPRMQDLDALREHDRVLAEEENYLQSFGHTTNTEEEDAAALKRIIERCNAQTKMNLVIEVEGKIVGAANVTMKTDDSDRHAAFGGITLEKEFRNQKLGKLLVDVALKEAEHHLPQLRVLEGRVKAPNKAALQLYESVGFEHVGTIPNGTSTVVNGEVQIVDEIVLHKQFNSE